MDIKIGFHKQPEEINMLRIIFQKSLLTLKISHGLQNRNNIEILMKLENFCVFSFLSLFCDRFTQRDSKLY